MDLLLSRQCPMARGITALWGREPPSFQQRGTGAGEKDEFAASRSRSLARMESRRRGWSVMERQCAWCLRIMDRFGEPVSAPQPKRYEVSHGMCRVCGSLWLEQAIRNTDEQEIKHRQRARKEVEEI